MAKAIIAANQLRQGDLLFLGVVQRASSPGSSSWIVATANHGHLFEVIGARNLTRDGLVDATRVRGMGIRAYGANGAYLVEGDLVEAIAGGDRFIDLKASGGNYNLDEVDRVFSALDQGVVWQFVFGHEAGAPLPQALQVKIGEVKRMFAGGASAVPKTLLGRTAFGKLSQEDSAAAEALATGIDPKALDEAGREELVRAITRYVSPAAVARLRELEQLGGSPARLARIDLEAAGWASSRRSRNWPGSGGARGHRTSSIRFTSDT